MAEPNEKADLIFGKQAGEAAHFGFGLRIEDTVIKDPLRNRDEIVIRHHDAVDIVFFHDFSSRSSSVQLAPM